jgi:hypothetical protein
MSKLTETTPEKSFNSTPTVLLEDVYFAPLLQALQTPGIAPAASKCSSPWNAKSQETESPSRENGLEASFGEDALHFFSFVTLDFDAAVFHGSTNTTGLLHLLRELLFFGQSDPNEISCNGDSLPSPMRGLANDIHSSAIGIFLPTLRRLRSTPLSRLG